MQLIMNYLANSYETVAHECMCSDATLLELFYSLCSCFPCLFFSKRGGTPNLLFHELLMTVTYGLSQNRYQFQ